MKFSQGKLGRTFLLRLEDGDRIPEVIEHFAKEQQISHGAVWFVGGAKGCSQIVVGPKDGMAQRPEPVIAGLPGVSETVGFGTLAPCLAGDPVLHLHASFGRGEKSMTGCTRAGVEVWHIGEVVILEFLEMNAARIQNPVNGFELLEILPERKSDNA